MIAKNARTKISDLQVQNCGSLFLFSALTDAGQAWLDEHCPNDEQHTYIGSSLVVEHHYAGDLADRATEDGLNVV